MHTFFRNIGSPRPKAGISAPVVVGIVIGLIFLGLVAYKYIPFGAAGGYQGRPPTPVTLTKLEREEAAVRVKLNGDARPRASAVVRSQVVGVVTNVLVAEGDFVQEGQALAVVDASDQQLALAEAEARLVEAESRLRELRNGTRSEVLTQREAEFRAAAAREKEARFQLEAVRRLAPDREAERKAEAFAAQARERDAKDQFERTKVLVKEGALASRDLITAESAYEAARGDRLRAEYAWRSQQTENKRLELAAEATLATAESDRAGAEAQLLEAERGPRPESVAAQAGLVNAHQSQVTMAALELARSEVASPVSGTVSSRDVGVGDRLEKNDPVATVVGSDLDVFFAVPEDYINRVEPGMKVVLTARALPDWSYPTTVTAVVAAADPSSRRQSIRVKAPQDKLLPNMAVQGELFIPQEGDYLVVHRDALVRRPTGWVIFASVPGEEQGLVAKMHPVEIVADLGETMAFRCPDLKAGDQVVQRGAQGLTDGGGLMPPKSEESK